MNKHMFKDGFDSMYKTGPNAVDRNAIKRCIEEGLTPEETAMKLRIKVASVRTYYPEQKPEQKAK